MAIEKKYLIIGQGLAGTILSMQMEERSIPHYVIDEPSISYSSKVAAGLINPVVLKRFKMVHNAESFLDYSKGFYRNWEKKLDQSFYNEIAIHHIFSKQENQNQWMEKSANPPFKRFLGDIELKSPSYLNSQFGIGIMKETAWLNTQKFINSYREYLINLKKFSQADIKIFDPKSLKAKYEVDEIILCTGHLIQKELKEEMLSPTRGELLTIKSDVLPNDAIYHAGVFILPIGASLFKVGATYHWDQLNDHPTEEGKNKLLLELKKMFNGDFQVVEHLAGVRPNVKDRKPLMGTYQDIHIFNGLGSRGVLMAPKLSESFINYLVNAQELAPEFDLKRFL